MSELLVTEHQLSVRHACRAVGLSRTAWYRRPLEAATGDGAVREDEVLDAYVFDAVSFLQLWHLSPGAAFRFDAGDSVD